MSAQLPGLACRDDNGRTALHWAAQLDCLPVARALLAGAAQKQAELQAEAAAAAAAKAAAAAGAGAGAAAGGQPADNGEGGQISVPPPLVTFQDKQGCTPLHLAARLGHIPSADLLLESAAASLSEEGRPGAADAVAALVKTKNKAGQSAVHMAALAGSASCAALLVGAAPEAAHARSKLGLTPADLAARRHHAELAAALRSKQPAAALAGLQKGPQAQGPRTLLVAPPECLFHFTCPAPITR